MSNDSLEAFALSKTTKASKVSLVGGSQRTFRRDQTKSTTRNTRTRRSRNRSLVVKSQVVAATQNPDENEDDQDIQKPGSGSIQVFKQRSKVLKQNTKNYIKSQRNGNFINKCVRENCRNTNAASVKLCYICKKAYHIRCGFRDSINDGILEIGRLYCQRCYEVTKRFADSAIGGYLKGKDDDSKSKDDQSNHNDSKISGSGKLSNSGNNNGINGINGIKDINGNNNNNNNVPINTGNNDNGGKPAVSDDTGNSLPKGDSAAGDSVKKKKGKSDKDEIDSQLSSQASSNGIKSPDNNDNIGISEDELKMETISQFSDTVTPGKDSNNINSNTKSNNGKIINNGNNNGNSNGKLHNGLIKTIAIADPSTRYKGDGVYSCDMCLKDIKYNKTPWTNDDFNQYIRLHICNNCKKKCNSKSVFKCIHSKCKKKDKYGNIDYLYYASNNALKSWSNHMVKHHCDNEILVMLNLQYCDHMDCTNLVKFSHKEMYCKSHQNNVTQQLDLYDNNNDFSGISGISNNNSNNGNTSNNNNSNNNNSNGKRLSSQASDWSQLPEYQPDLSENKFENDYSNSAEYKCKDGNILYMMDLFFHIDTVKHRLHNKFIKDKVALALVDAMADIANDNPNPITNNNIMKRGIIKYMLIPGVFLFKIYRDDEQLFKLESQRRERLFNNQNWIKLVNRITSNQDKINKRRMKWIEKDLKREQARKQCIEQTKSDNDKISNNNSVNNNNSINIQDDIKMDINNNNNNNNGMHSKPNINSKNNMSCKPPSIVKFSDMKSHFQKLQYNEAETINDVNNRMKRAQGFAELGQWKKADKALEQTKLVNIYKNGNMKKALSKFPSENTKSIKRVKMKQKLKIDRQRKEMITQTLLDINPSGCGGKIGIENKFIIWMIKNDNLYSFISTFCNLLCKIINNGVLDIVRDLLMFSKGFLSGKEKFGQFDYDVRPIVVTGGIIRGMDKVICKLVGSSNRKKLIGPYQIIGEKQALEKAKVAVTQARRIQQRKNGLVMVNFDAANAYNNGSRVFVYNIIKKVSPLLTNWVCFMYSRNFKVEIDFQNYINFRSGWIQGHTSSEMLYSTGKWSVEKRAIRRCQIRFKKEFKIYFKMDYVDDGINMIYYKHVKYFIEVIIEEYIKYNITINLSKSKLILISNNLQINDSIKLLSEQFKIKYDFSGNFVFLGVPYGTNIFINDTMNNKIDKLFIKFEYITIIQSVYIKHNLIRKFYGFNKIIYWLKVVKKLDLWMGNIQSLYQNMLSHITCGMNRTELMAYQIPMAQKNGGLGLRDPKNYQFAAEIATLRDKEEFIMPYFPFMISSFNNDYVKDQKNKIVKNYAEFSDYAILSKSSNIQNISFKKDLDYLQSRLYIDKNNSYFNQYIYGDMFNNNFDNNNNNNNNNNSININGINPFVSAFPLSNNNNNNFRINNGNNGNNDIIVSTVNNNNLSPDGYNSDCSIFNNNNNNNNNFNINPIDIVSINNWFYIGSFFYGEQDEIESLNELYDELIQNHRANYYRVIKQFNKIVGPKRVFDPNRHRTHNHLINLMDKKWLALFNEKASEQDSARLLSLQNNGALSWLNMPYNLAFSHTFDNRQMHIALSLILGAPIIKDFRFDDNDTIFNNNNNGNNLYNNVNDDKYFQVFCNNGKCHEEVDKYGYHALSCPHGGFLIKRHDAVCGVINNILKQAGFHTTRESRYINDGNGNYIKNLQRPGDIKIHNWTFDDNTVGDYYVDFTIGNIFSKSYINHTSKSRIWLANKLEEDKDKKYKNKDNINGIGMQVLGGMGPALSGLIKKASCDLGMMSHTPDTVWLNRFRSRIMSTLMKHNVNMINHTYYPSMVDDI